MSARASHDAARGRAEAGGLDGRVVVVTGSSRGIGAGIASCLLAAGARVLGVSRTPPVDRDERLAWLECDLLADDATERVIVGALDAYGRVDALVNNAGLLLPGACWRQSDAELDAMIELNLTAPFRLSQRFARHWIDHGARGAILNICSIESEVAWADPPQAAYAATKGGLLGLTRALALELAEYGIRVLAIGPGAIATAMTADSESVRAAIPLGHRLGTPAEIGELTAFLLSDAASYVTGEIVYADGGYLLA